MNYQVIMSNALFEVSICMMNSRHVTCIRDVPQNVLQDVPQDKLDVQIVDWIRKERK